MKIGKKNIGNNSTFFVAEEGQANLGDLNYAFRMVDAAAKTGVDAIEFQLANADDFYVKSHDMYKIYKDREFSEFQLKQLSEYVRSKDLELIVSPFSVRMVEIMANNGCSAFNINASDLVTPDIIDSVIDTKLPFFLSLLFASEEEIDWAVDRVIARGGSNYALLLGQHAMGNGNESLSVEHTNLGYISTLRNKYKVPVGFIDHTPEIWMPSCAVASGASIITKHLALSRAEKGPDWQICLEPGEMRRSVEWVRSIKKSVSSIKKTIAPGENFDKSLMRRSIVSTNSLKKGDIIKKKDICFKRPGSGIPANREVDVIGKRLISDLEKDQVIKIEHLGE